MAYKWANNSRVHGNAEVVGRVLERIAQEGPMTPDRVLDEARDTASPLHPLFQWDDTIAAEEWRLWQARYIVRSIKVVIDNNGKEHEARAFVSLNVEVEDGISSPAYLNTVQVMADTDLRRQLLAKALQEIAWWERRYKEYEDLAPILAAVRQVRELVTT